MKPQQPLPLRHPAERDPAVWRAAAETARHDPHYSAADRARRADLFEQRARELEAGND